MRVSVALLLLVALPLRLPAEAPEATARVLDGGPLAEGLDWSRWRVPKRIRDYSRLANLVRSYANDAVHLHVVVVDPERFDVAVVDATDLPAGETASRRSVRDIAEGLGAICAVNAGFYDESDRPVGLHVSRGRTLRPWGMRHKTSAGVLYFHDGRWKIIANGTYRAYWVRRRPPKPMTEAVQCYPLLVAKGRVLRSWQAGSKIAARSAVGLDARGRLLFAVTENDILSGLSLCEMAEFMRSALGCEIALNLDGGPSSQLYLRHGTTRLEVPGRAAIRCAIAVFPRGKAPRMR